MNRPENGQRPSIRPDSPPASIADGLRGLHPADIAAALEHLNGETLRDVLAELDSDTAADVLIRLDERPLGGVLDALDASEIADMASELKSDDAADIIGLLKREKRADVLSELEVEERAGVEELLRYEDESAGGIMASELVYVNSDAKCQDAIEVIRKAADEVEDVHNVYVTDRGGRLRGVLPLRRLVVAKPDVRVADVMDPDVVSVSADMDQEDVANLFMKYDLVAVPVIDPNGVLVGRITVDDIIDVMKDEADEDMSIMAGTSDEEFHEDSALRVSRIRLPWLVVGALGGLGSACVMDFYRVSLEKALALRVLRPGHNRNGRERGASDLHNDREEHAR